MKKRDAYKILEIDNNVDNIKLNKLYKKELLENRPYERYSFDKDDQLAKQLNNDFSILKTLNLTNDKKKLLHEFKILVNNLNLKKEYLQDNLIGEIYNEYFEEEFKLFNNTSELIINCNDGEINNIIQDNALKHNKLISEFILKIFKKFYNKYHVNAGSYWLKIECINYIEKASISDLDTINTSCKYYFESRKIIFRSIIEKSVDSRLANISKDKRIEYKQEIVQKLLSNFDYDRLFENYELIINTVDEYIKEKTTTKFFNKLALKVKEKTKKLIKEFDID